MYRPDELGDISWRFLTQVFNHMMRKPNQWPGISAPDGSHVMSGWDGQASSALGGSSRRFISAIHLGGTDQVTLGALPLALFQNGHGYFVQASRLHAEIALRSQPEI